MSVAREKHQIFPPRGLRRGREGWNVTINFHAHWQLDAVLTRSAFIPSGADDKFRANFLWGRKPMLAACAARLSQCKDLIWVDLGGGTGVGMLELVGLVKSSGSLSKRTLPSSQHATGSISSLTLHVSLLRCAQTPHACVRSHVSMRTLYSKHCTHFHPLQENVDMMFEYMPIECFKAIYVVDLCHSLCEVCERSPYCAPSTQHWPS